MAPATALLHTGKQIRSNLILKSETQVVVSASVNMEMIKPMFRYPPNIVTAMEMNVSVTNHNAHFCPFGPIGVPVLFVLRVSIV